MRSACSVSLDTVNSNKGVRGSITVKSANKIRHVNQQKTVQKHIPMNVRKKNPEKGCIFLSGSSYAHSSDHAASKNYETKAEVELKEKVNQLENTVAELSTNVEGMKADKFEQLDNVVRALVRKVLSLESE